MRFARRRPLDRRAAGALVAALIAFAPAACKQAEAVEVEHYQPSKITPVEGSDHPLVTLTERGAKKIGLETTAVEKGTQGKAIPYSAVLYDAAEGQPYVFVNPEGLTFHREDVAIDSIDGDTVILSSGPPAGTNVVTVGVAQVHGAELEYGAY